MERQRISCTGVLVIALLTVTAHANHVYIEVPRFWEIGERVDGWSYVEDRVHPHCGQLPPGGSERGYDHEEWWPDLHFYENYFGEAVWVREDEAHYDTYRADMSWSQTQDYLAQRRHDWELIDEGFWDGGQWHPNCVYHDYGVTKTYSSVTEWRQVLEVPEPTMVVLIALGSLTLRRKSVGRTTGHRLLDEDRPNGDTDERISC